MAIFPVSSTFGPLFFIISKLFARDFVLWVVLFAIFAISFQIGFSSLAIQAGYNPLDVYPSDNGTFPVSYFAIIGEFSYLMQEMSASPIGVAFLGIYTFIAQVMLVNLLIAMMGDTYTTVRQNSDVEWKFYRRVFVRDNVSASAFPPPLNLLGYFYMFLVGVVNALTSLVSSQVIKLRLTRVINFKSPPTHSTEPVSLSPSSPPAPSLPSPSPSSSHLVTGLEKSMKRSDSQASLVLSSPPGSPLATSTSINPLLSSRRLSRYYALLDDKSDEVEDISKVMRVTLDRIAEKNEREDSESPLAQIVQTKKAIQLDASHKKIMESKLDHLLEKEDASVAGITATLEDKFNSVIEMIHENRADQKMGEKKSAALEKKIVDMHHSFEKKLVDMNNSFETKFAELLSAIQTKQT